MSIDLKSLGELFRLSRDAVIGIRDGSVVFANPAAEELLSVGEGDPAAVLFPEHFLEDMTGGSLSTLTHGGRTFCLSAIREGDLTLFCLAPIRPVSEELMSWSRALYSFGTDLLSMRLSADAILSGQLDQMDENRRRYAAVLYQSYYRMKRLHDHMILAGNLMRGAQPLKKRLVPLGALCGELCATVRPLIRGTGVELTFSDESGDCLIEGDRALIETMLLNLMTNSLLHMSGGVISMTLTVRRSRCIIALSDTGSGIAPTGLAALFSRTFSPDLSDTTAGAGLGLLIARGIAELHGGTLVMESREGEGTTLRISLPYPDDSMYLKVHHPDTEYRVDGMDAVLTELSVALDKSVYDERMFD